MRQCVFVVGTRAQLVKVAPVLLYANQTGLEHVVWLTGQHDESVDDLIDDFAVRSRFVRPVPRKERSSILRLMTWFPRTFFACRRFLRAEGRRFGAAPVVVVHGDTLSTWLGALAARFAGGIVMHLESGLSSGSIADPFPEELLRRLTFRLTDVALCPNDEAFERMQKRNGCEVIHTGENTLLDCVRLAVASAGRGDLPPKYSYFVASLHRFQNIYHLKSLARIVEELVSLSAVAPVHFILHPTTELRLKRHGFYEHLENTPGMVLRRRMPYTEFLGLIAGARGVFSDGGSNQEELSYLGVPTVLFRRRSERPDGLGENVVLRDETGSSLLDYVLSGRFDALRRQPQTLDSVAPSRTTVEKLVELVDS